ncbi:MAG: hypothetical protein ACJ78Q_05775 [Chloroflexia bacterium]
MRIRVVRQRGDPIYFRSNGRTVSLVPEVAVREWRIGGDAGFVLHSWADPVVFVIDEKGVRRVTLRDPRMRRRVAIVGLLAVLIVWLTTSVRRTQGDEPGRGGHA